VLHTGCVAARISFSVRLIPFYLLQVQTKWQLIRRVCVSAGDVHAGAGVQQLVLQRAVCRRDVDEGAS